MDGFSSFFSSFPLILGYLGELFFIIALFLIHNKFKTIETYVMFYVLLFMTILQYSAKYIMQAPEAMYSESGEIISVIQPSEMFEYTLYLLPYSSIVVYSALLVFTIKLYRR